MTRKYAIKAAMGALVVATAAAATFFAGVIRHHSSAPEAAIETAAGDPEQQQAMPVSRYHADCTWAADGQKFSGTVLAQGAGAPETLNVVEVRGDDNESVVRFRPGQAYCDYAPI